MTLVVGVDANTAVEFQAARVDRSTEVLVFEPHPRKKSGVMRP